MFTRRAFYLSVNFLPQGFLPGDFMQLAANMGNSLEMLSTPKLIALKNGHHDAFVEVYNVLHIKIFRFFQKRVGLHDTVKDLTQQCFIRLWQFRHTLSEEHPLEKQVYIIARSLLINHLKKESTHKRLIAVHIQQTEKEVQLPASESLFEMSGELTAAIDTLPPVRKKVILLKAFEGFSNKEIAEQMSISVKTVEDHVTKAFRHIREVVVIILIISLLSLY